MEDLDAIQSKVLIRGTNTNGDTVLKNVKQYRRLNNLIGNEDNKEYKFWSTDEVYSTDNQDHKSNHDNNYGVISESNDDISPLLPLKRPLYASNIPNDGVILLISLFSSIYRVMKSKDPISKDLIGELIGEIIGNVNAIQRKGFYGYGNNYYNGMHSDIKLEWILKKYPVDNNDIDDTTLECIMKKY